MLLGNGAPVRAQKLSSQDTLNRTAVIHYVYFENQPIMPYAIEQIRRSHAGRYKFSALDVLQLYRLLKRHGTRAPYYPNTTRLVIDPNQWGPRTLVGNEGHVKLGTSEYRLSEEDFNAVKRFIYARIPPPQHCSRTERFDVGQKKTFSSILALQRFRQDRGKTSFRMTLHDN